MARAITSGSSPHTRGAPTSFDPSPAGTRIIPAYAGCTSRSPLGSRSSADHPRIRGVHAQSFATSWRIAGSSPHTRGAPVRHEDCGERERIIPAYAGCTGFPFVVGAAPPDHPRIRGVHAPKVRPLIVASGSSPHTRGALLPGSPEGHRGRIIPAYAGCTGARRRRRAGPRDHPRIRGVHRMVAVVLRLVVGSSPHTRGARLDLGLAHLVVGIIPAYAGCTGSGWRPAL